MITRARDGSWIRQAFLLPERALNDSEDVVRRFYTTASQKFTDTTLGGNFVVNPLPQYTRYADVKAKNQYSYSKGMGRVYSETIDDNKSVITIRLGVPRFNSLTRFFGEFYSVEASSLARTGRGTDVFYTLGRAGGYLLGAPLMPFLLTGKMIRFFVNCPSSRYYYLKPTMFTYWNAVTSAVNAVAVNMGVVPRVMTDDLANAVYEEDKPDKETGARFHKALPDLYLENGSIDVFAISTRAQRLSNYYYEALDNEIAKGKSKKEVFQSMVNWQPPKDGRNASLEQYKKLYLNSSPEGEFKGAELPELDDRSKDKMNSFKDFYDAERKLGADFISFRVDNMGTQSESFRSSTKESGIASTINSISSNARAARFNLADGNLEGTGVVKGIYDAATSFLKGVTDSLEIQGIATLMGSAFVDIPYTYDSSSADINTTSFTISLRSPYGNKLARLQNLVFPMMCLLTAAVPLSTGKQSYTSPFILELFNRGRTQIQLGMIRSLTFTRGVGDIGWTQDGQFLGVDCNVEIEDLSKVLHMPLEQNFTLSNAVPMAIGQMLGGDKGAAAAAALMPSSYDADNLFTSYTATLGSLSLPDQIYKSRKLRLRLTRQLADYKSWTSNARMASWMMDGLIGDIIGAFSMETSRVR